MLQAKIISYLVIAVILSGSMYYVKRKYDQLIETQIELKQLKSDFENFKSVVEESNRQKEEIYSTLKALENKQNQRDVTFRAKLKSINNLPKNEQVEVIDQTYIDILNCIENISGDIPCGK